MKWDLIIIGAGPAGLTAGLYAARYKIKTLVIGMLPGGTVTEAHKVCNFPSYENIGGVELMLKMIKQIKDIGVEIKSEEVISVGKKDFFRVATNKGEYSAKKIIIATGSKRMKLGVEREEEMMGQGISYCATCDANFYKDKIVGVVGGGNSALTSALLLSRVAKKVYIIYRQEKFSKAEPMWIDDVEKEKKITPIFNSVVLKLIGKKKLEEIEIEKDGKKKKVKLDCLFIEIGGISNIKLAKLLGIRLEKNFIDVDKEQKTNVEGVFAAGDVTNNPLKQIVTACGEGAVAAFSVFKELRK